MNITDPPALLEFVPLDELLLDVHLLRVGGVAVGPLIGEVDIVLHLKRKYLPQGILTGCQLPHTSKSVMA